MFLKIADSHPETSNLFHFLNYILRCRQLCNNLLLEHEGDCPPWISECVSQSLAIYDEAASLLQV
jgi:hypothetical protein